MDWIDSSVWDKYYIENNLEIIYDTSEALIEDYLKDYNSTEGCDQGEFLFLEQIPVTWAVKDGTVYSVEPGHPIPSPGQRSQTGTRRQRLEGTGGFPPLWRCDIL